MLLQHVRFHPQGVDHIAPGMLVGAGNGPGLRLVELFRGGDASGRGQLHRLHHLAHHAVGKDHHRVQIFVRQVKGLINQIHAFLNAGGGQNGDLGVAVIAAPGDLRVVRLTGLYTAHAGAAPADVQHHHGHLRRADEAQALLHQRQSGRAGGDEHSAAGSGGAVSHVDGGQLALRL